MSRGKARPASTTTIEPSHSYTVRFLPTSPRPPSATIRQVPSIARSVRGWVGPADRALMRPSRAVLGTTVLGGAAVLASLWRVRGVALTPFALFLAAAILIELFEESDRERSREPVESERFRLGAAVQVAALLVLGPWAG